LPFLIQNKNQAFAAQNKVLVLKPT
jgi:hypothetical protein